MLSNGEIDYVILINDQTHLCRRNLNQAYESFEYFCTHNDQDDIKLIKSHYNRFGGLISETVLKHRPLN